MASNKDLRDRLKKAADLQTKLKYIENVAKGAEFIATFGALLLAMIFSLGAVWEFVLAVTAYLIVNIIRQYKEKPVKAGIQSTVNPDPKDPPPPPPG